MGKRTYRNSLRSRKKHKTHESDISVFGFDEETERFLRKNSINTAYELLSIPTVALMKKKSLSEQILNDIRGRLDLIGLSLSSCCVGNATLLDSDYKDSIILSETSLNPALVSRLSMNGITTFGELEKLTVEELLSFQGVGVGKVNEIRRFVRSVVTNTLESILASARESGLCEFPKWYVVEESGGNNRSSEIYPGPVYDEVCKRRKEILDAEGLSDVLLSMTVLKEPIVLRLESSGINTLGQLADRSVDELLAIKSVGPTKVAEMSKLLEDALDGRLEDVLKYDVRRKELSDPGPMALGDWTGTLKPKSREALELRLSGLTLQEVGDKLGLTRERVRQITEKALSQRPKIFGDEYLPLIEKYDISKEIFARATGEKETVFYLLQLANKTKKCDLLSPLRMLEDESVTDCFKDAVKVYAKDYGFVFVGDQAIELNKKAIATYLLKVDYDGRPVAIDDLMTSYDAFLEKYGIDASGSLGSHSERAFSSCLDRYENIISTCLPNTNESNAYRYFASSGHFDFLEEAMSILIDLNIECSTELLMRDDSIREVMELLDIHNSIELHAALRKFYSDIPGLKLGRSPMLTLGTADRHAQIMELIKELSPVNVEYLSEEYSRRYGVRPDTFRGSYLGDFKMYFKDGLYRYEHHELTEREATYLKDLVRDAGGYIAGSLLVKKHKQKFPECESLSLSQEALNSIDCYLSSSLVISKEIDVTAVFSNLIESHDYFDAKTEGFNNAVVRTSEFNSVLQKALRRFEVVDLGRGRYINSRVLEKNEPPITNADLKEFMNAAIDFMIPGVPYTLHSLIDSGFDHVLFTGIADNPMLGRVLEGVMLQGYIGGAIRRTSFMQKYIFCKKPGSFSLPDVLKYFVKSSPRGMMTERELLYRMEILLNGEVDSPQLRMAIKRSSLSYTEDGEFLICS